MPNLNRVAVVRAGRPGEDGIEISQNRVRFRCIKTDTEEANDLEVMVYNLNQSSRALLEDTQNTVTLLAGYSGSDPSQVATGDISRGETSWRPPETVTIAYCGDGLRTLRDSRVSLTYAYPVSARSVVTDIAAAMEIAVRDTGVDLSGTYPQGWAFAGPARKALSLVTKRFGLAWSVQSQEIVLTERRGPAQTEAVLITPSTGMYGSPLPIDDISTNLSEDKEEPGLLVVTQLNPAIEPRSIVVIESRDYERAEYRVRNVEHRGDTHGSEWESILEVTEV